MKHITFTCDICHNVVDIENELSKIQASEKFHISSGGDIFIEYDDVCTNCTQSVKNGFRETITNIRCRGKAMLPGDRLAALESLVAIAGSAINEFQNYIDMSDQQIRESNKTRGWFLDAARMFANDFNNKEKDYRGKIK